MKYPLDKICTIQSGVHIKSSEFEEKGSHVYLNLRDFDESHALRHDLTRVDFDGKPQFIVDKEDILFSARINFKAFKIPTETDDKFIASTSFMILKPNQNIILKDYLYWFLNNSEELKRLNEVQAKNTRMPYLSLNNLKKLEIEVPELDVQVQIIAIAELLKKERVLTEKILALKEIYLQNLLFNTAKL